MKTIFITVALFIIFGMVNAQEKIEISEDLSARIQQDSVYLITHVFPRYGSNSLFVLLPQRKGVLIDTPNETTGTKDLVEWIEGRFGKLELIAINTGWHQDNLGGNEYLRSLDIDIYGPDLTASMIKDHGKDLKEMLLESTSNIEDQRYYESYQELELTPPNKLFSIKDGLNLEYGTENFQVYYPGESHTVDNTVVYLKKRNFLYGGCMILSMQHRRPGFTGHANMKEWPISVQKVSNSFPDCELVIPGHGNPGNKALLNNTIEVLERYNKDNPE